MDIIKKTVKAKTENLYGISSLIEEELEKRQASMKVTNLILVSFEEIFTNICLYAYGQENSDNECSVEISLDEQQIIIKFIDKGMFFNPLELTDPNINAKAEERNIGGLGIYLVKKTMDECTYVRSKDNENIFTMKKELK